MTPKDYGLHVTITRKKSRHLNYLKYEVYHSINQTDQIDHDFNLLPGQTYRVCYGYGSFKCHTFKIIAKTIYGEIESNEISIPCDCYKIAMEIITEHSKGNNYSLRLVEVPVIDQDSLLKGADDKGILYESASGEIHRIEYTEARKAWIRHMFPSAIRPKYIGSYISSDDSQKIYSDRICFYKQPSISFCFSIVNQNDIETCRMIVNKIRSMGYDIYDLDRKKAVNNDENKVKALILHK